MVARSISTTGSFGGQSFLSVSYFFFLLQFEQGVADGRLHLVYESAFILLAQVFGFDCRMDYDVHACAFENAVVFKCPV